MKSKFEKIIINECTHNQSRPDYVIKDILSKIEKFTRQKNHQSKKMSESISKDMTISYSIDKKRGIFLYTPSKEKQNRTIQYQNEPRNSYATIQHHHPHQSQPKSPKSISTTMRRSAMKFKNPNLDNCMLKAPLRPERKHMSNMATIDVQTTNLIT